MQPGSVTRIEWKVSGIMNDPEDVAPEELAGYAWLGAAGWADVFVKDK